MLLAKVQRGSCEKTIEAEIGIRLVKSQSRGEKNPLPSLNALEMLFQLFCRL